LNFLIYKEIIFYFFISEVLKKTYRTIFSEGNLFTIKYYLDCKPPVAKLNLTTQRKKRSVYPRIAT
jgi:hypothetical protein